MKLAIDLGSRNVKVCCVGADGKIKTDIFKSQATTNTFGQKNVVEFNGSQIALGVGNTLIEQDKTERKYLEETILLATNMLFGNSRYIEIDLAIGLPIHTYKSDNKKQKLQNKLDTLVGSTIKGTVNDIEINVKINSVKICAEGYSAFLSVCDDLPKLPTTFIDWGYKTTDVIHLSIEDGDWNLETSHTVSLGIYDILSVIKDDLYNIDVDLSQEQIDHYLRSTPIIPTQQGLIDIKRDYLKNGKTIVDDIMQQLKVVMPALLSSNIYMTGGGSQIAVELTDNQYKNVYVLPDQDKSLFANVSGYLAQI